MSLEKSSIVWSAKQLKGMVINGKINFDHIVQRSYVWERSRKSALIESMIIGYPIPPVFAKRIVGDTTKRGDNVYYIMDGKQRLSTVKEFLNDEFSLTELVPVKYYDDDAAEEFEIDISGKKFSELPDALQNYLMTCTFNVTYFDNLTREEERELFKRLNAGKPLSAKSRLLASCKNIDDMLNLGEHPLFTDMLSEKALANKNQVTIIAKAWCMLNQEIKDVSFESKVLNPIMESMSISDNEKFELGNVFDYIMNVHANLVENKKSIAKKFYTETHMISLIPFVRKAIENGISIEMFANWIESFYGTNGMSNHALYADACGAGSAKSSNIFDRNDALETDYNSFFAAE